MTETQISELPGYNLVHKNRINRSRGGVAIYVKSDIEYKIRDAISIFDGGEFESSFIETNSCTAVNTVIGEIYRIPNSNPNLSVKRYEHIFVAVEVLGASTRVGHCSCTQAFLHVGTHQVITWALCSLYKE